MLWKLSYLGLECTWRIYYIELRLLHLCPCASPGVCWWAWSSGVATAEHRHKWFWRSSDYVNFPNPVFRIRLFGPNPVFRIRLPGPNPIPILESRSPNPTVRAESRFPFGHTQGEIKLKEACSARGRRPLSSFISFIFTYLLLFIWSLPCPPGPAPCPALQDTLRICGFEQFRTKKLKIKFRVFEN
jgi:hypothetical protein